MFRHGTECGHPLSRQDQRLRLDILLRLHATYITKLGLPCIIESRDDVRFLQPHLYLIPLIRDHPDALAQVRNGRLLLVCCLKEGYALVLLGDKVGERAVIEAELLAVAMEFLGTERSAGGPWLTSAFTALL